MRGNRAVVAAVWMLVLLASVACDPASAAGRSDSTTVSRSGIATGSAAAPAASSDAVPTPFAAGAAAAQQVSSGQSAPSASAARASGEPDRWQTATSLVWIPAGDHQVPGWLTTPAGEDHRVPAVLLLHGDTASKNNPLLTHLEPLLAQHGIASLAIDFAGSGDSKQPQTALTYPGMMSDAWTAFTYLQHQPDIDASRVAILGHSRGGTVAADLAGSNPGVAAEVTWAGYVINGFDEDPPDHRIAEEKGSVTVGGWTYSLAWFDSIEASTSFTDGVRYTGPVLSVVGSADPLVTPALAEAFVKASASSDKQLKVIDGAGHDLGLSTSAAMLDTATDTTISWLVSRLQA